MWERIKMAWDVLLGRAYATPYLYQTRIHVVSGTPNVTVKMQKLNNPDSWVDI